MGFGESTEKTIDRSPRWPWSKLGVVATVRARIGWKALTASEYVEDGYAFLSTPNIKDRDIDYQNVNYITEFRYLESPELCLQPGDVLLAKDGNTLGIVNIVRSLPRAATVNGSIAVIRPYGIEGEFLRYYLSSTVAQGMIARLKDGMGVPHLFQADIRKLPVPLPSGATQAVIVGLLDRETCQIDRLIESKKRMLALLAEREQVMIDQFFDPTLRASSRLKYLLAQFPCYGVLVPRFESGGVPFIRVNDLGRVDSGSSPEVAIEPRQSEEYARTVVDLGDVLVSVVGSIDKVAVVRAAAAGANVARAVARLVPRPDVPPELLAAWLRTSSYRRQAELAVAGGTAQPTLNMGDLANFVCHLPETAERQDAYAELKARLQPVENVKRTLNRQIFLLGERRQALITAAVTGQLDIPGAVA